MRLAMSVAILLMAALAVGAARADELGLSTSRHLSKLPGLG